jgi:hypothetical protein
LNAFLEVHQSRLGKDWVGMRIYETRKNHTATAVEVRNIAGAYHFGTIQYFCFSSGRHNLSVIAQNSSMLDYTDVAQLAPAARTCFSGRTSQREKLANIGQQQRTAARRLSAHSP